VDRGILSGSSTSGIRRFLAPAAQGAPPGVSRGPVCGIIARAVGSRMVLAIGRSRLTGFSSNVDAKHNPGAAQNADGHFL